MGVMKNWRNPGICRRDGHSCANRLSTRPLMWDPSWSWSVMMSTLPYRRLWVSAYTLLCCRPRICFSWLTSAFLAMAAGDAWRTLRSLPRSGKTPNVSRPTTDSPLTASALAESPSVRMRVHSLDRERCPAQLASSSFGMPSMRPARLPSVFFRSLVSLRSALARAEARTDVCLATLWKKLSGMRQVDPNLAALVVSVSFVCESKLGLSMRQLTKTPRWFRTCSALTPKGSLAFFAWRALSILSSPSTTCAATASTCFPPRFVQTPLTKLTCWNPAPSPAMSRESVTAISHRSPTRRYALRPSLAPPCSVSERGEAEEAEGVEEREAPGSGSKSAKYSWTYSRKPETGTRVPLK
mmetsp:Transcript_3264/g.4730  ORF Transcript_3264/g.4730 Transcript_3264/m.4730 type:complete len:354 (-) Transcript_3264:1160-2221(-)